MLLTLKHVFEILCVLSILPPLISDVVKTELGTVITPVVSAMVADEVPSLALMFVTSRFAESTVVALTFVIFPVVEDMY